DERARTAAATTRVAALFSRDRGPKQQLLPLADYLIGLRGHLPERDAGWLARECLRAIQSPNRDQNSFHAAVAVLAAYRRHRTATGGGGPAPPRPAPRARRPVGPQRLPADRGRGPRARRLRPAPPAVRRPAVDRPDEAAVVSAGGAGVGRARTRPPARPDPPD